MKKRTLHDVHLYFPERSMNISGLSDLNTTDTVFLSACTCFKLTIKRPFCEEQHKRANFKSKGK